MNELEALFQAMKSQGMVPEGKSFDDFRAAHSIPNKQADLYSFASANGLIENGMQQSAFMAKYFAEPVKKKEDGGAASSTPSSTSTASAPDAVTSTAPEPQPANLLTSPMQQSTTAAPQVTQAMAQPFMPDFTRTGTTDHTLGLALMRHGLTVKDITITGNEDPAKAGEEIRQGQDKAYNYRKKYDEASAYRQEKRQIENVAIFGERARKQASFANDQLKMQFGDKWQDRLEYLSNELKGLDPKTATPEQFKKAVEYNKIVNDDFFKTWQAAQAAGEKSFEQYKALSKSGEYGKVEATTAANRKLREQNDTLESRTMDGAVRMAGQAIASLLTLPRTVMRAGAGAVSPAAQIALSNEFTQIDKLASYGDAAVEWTNEFAPKASKYEQRVFEKRVPYQGKFVAVDDKGQPTAVRDKNGNLVQVGQSFIDDFNASGEAKNAKTEFTGAGNVLDKVAGITADMLVMRYLGGGTKVGTMLSSGAMMHQQSYNEAIKDLNMNPNDAAQYAMLTSGIQGAIEAYVGNIESTLGKTGRLAKPLTTAQLKPLVGKMSARELATARVMPILESVGSENLEEVLQQVADNQLKGQFNAATGAKLDNKFDLNDLKEMVVLTTLATAPMGNVQSLTAIDDMKRRAALAMSEGPDRFEYALSQLQENGALNPAQADEVRKRAATIRQYAQNLPKDLSEDQKSAALAKEWSRMELEVRAKDETTMPAQRDEAKKAATSLKNEIQQDLKTEPAPEEPLDEGEQPESAGRIGNMLIAPEEPAAHQPPLEVQRQLPDAYRQADSEAPASTVIAEMYSNQQPATAAADAYDEAPETTGDEIGDIAIQTLKDKGYEPTEQEGGQIRRFFADSLRQQGDTPVDEAFGTLADEYIKTNTDQTPAKNRMAIESIEDKAAQFFDGGGKVNPQSFDRNADKRLRDDKSVSSLYFKRDGANIDQLAQSWADEFGISEPEAVQRITDFMVKHGKKNVGEYMANRVAEQENTKQEARDQQVFDEETQDADLTEEEAQAIRHEVPAEVNEAINSIDEQTAKAMETWLSQFTDDHGRVKPAAVREALVQADLTPADQGFDPAISAAWDTVPEDGKNIIRRMAAGKETNIGITKAQTQVEDIADEGQSFEDFIKDHPDRQALIDEWNNGGEFRWAATLSDDAYARVEQIVSNEQTEGTPDQGGNEQQGAATTEPTQASQTPGENQGAELAPATSGENAGRRPLASDTAERIEVETNLGLAESDDTILEAIREIDEALSQVSLPTRLTPALVSEMADQGLVTLDEANQIITALNSGEELPEQLQTRAEAQLEGLREVPSWLSAFNNAVAARTEQVLNGTAQPGQPIIAEHAGEVMVGNVSNAQAQTLRAAGATLRGRAWVFPAEQKDAVFAQLFKSQPLPKPTGSFAGMVNRFLGKNPAGAKGMKDAVAQADGTDAKIDAAARHITPDVAQNRARAIKVGEHLSKKFGVEVVTDPDDINRALVDSGMPEHVGNPNVRGFAYNGKVYVNLAEADSEVPIHEFGHLWEAAMRGTDEHAGFTEAVRGSKYEAAVRANPAYAGLSEDDIMAEAMAHAIGQRGALIANDSAWVGFQDALKKMWLRAKAVMGIDVQDMRAQEFADYVATMLVEDAEPVVSLNKTDPRAQFLFVGEPGRYGTPLGDIHAAIGMELNGQSAQEIWLATGWFRGVDNAWRYMIADNEASLKISASALAGEAADNKGIHEYRLGEILHHPELFRVHPELAAIKITNHEGGGFEHTTIKEPLRPASSKINVDAKHVIEKYPLPDEALLGILLHEIQHSLQHKFGFARGGNPGVAAEIADSAAEIIGEGTEPAKSLTDKTAHELYQSLAGEVEARLVQDLRTYDKEELDEPPTSMMDVAPEDQILLFGSVREASQMLAKKKQKPAFLFGRKQVNNAGAEAAARQIIEDEINAGKDPAATGTLDKLSKLGVNRATAERIYSEVKGAKNVRIVSMMGEKAFADQTLRKLKNLWNEYFRVRGLAPRTLFDEKLKTQAEIKGHIYGAQQAVNRLDNAIKKTLTKNTEQNRNLVWQQVQNVLEGTQDIQTLDPSLHDGINELRTRLDNLTRALVISGAVGPSMAITMLNGTGVDIQAAAPDMVVNLKKALSKYPSERNQQDETAIEDFLQQYGGAMGTYLYRSYQANDDKDWKTQVPAETVARAKAKLEEMIKSEMADEMQKLQDKAADLDAGIDGLRQEITDKIDIAKAAAKDLQDKVNQIAQEQADYTKDKGKPNKALQRQELAAARRLRALQQMIRQADAMANLSPADFALMIKAPGFDPVVLNTIMKFIYGRRRKMMELEDRKTKAQTASYARLQYLDSKLANLDNEIETMLEREEKASIMAAGKLGSVSSAITQGRRKDIPVEFRDLLGEYRDPRVNMMRSVMRVATALENQKFLLAVKDAGLKEGWLATKDTKTGNITVELASPNSDTMDPLNGLWTTPEIARVFNEANHRKERSWMARLYYQTVGAVKVGKTVLSTGSQGRNYMSNIFQAIYNGWIGIPVGGQKFDAFIESFKAFKTTQSMKDALEFEELVRAGVLSNSTTAGEIREAAENLSLAAQGLPPKGIAPKVAHKTYEFLAKVYQSSDEMLRIWGFRVERERYARAMFGKPYTELTPAQQKESFDYGVKVIRMITPDYSLIPKIGELLRLNPLTGTFVSWQMEVFRNYFNRFALAREEIRNPRLRHIGLSRLAYLAVGHGIWAGMAAALAAAAGIGDDEEDAIDPWLKPWQQGTTKLWTDKDEKKGEWTFFNLGYIDPYAFWQQPYSMVTAPTERPLMDKSIDALIDLGGPIIQPDLVAVTAAQAFSNTNFQTGKKIMIPEYGVGVENVHRMYSFIRKRLQPGILRTATDLIDAGSVGVVDEYGNVKTPLSIGANAIGLNFETVQPKMAFGKYLLEQKSHKESILEAFNRLRYTELANLNRAAKAGQLSEEQYAARRDAAAEKIRSMYELTDKVYNQHLHDLGQQMRNANRYLGLSMHDIHKELKDNRYNADEIAVIIGSRPSLKPKLRKIKFN